MTDSIARAPSGLTGMWGELAVVLALRSSGCTVEWDGGTTPDHDLRAQSPDGTKIRVQVKTSTAPSGRIYWRKAGEPALVWGQSVRDAGELPIFVFVHFPELAVARIDDQRKVLTVEMPEGYLVTAGSPEDFAYQVDATRADYGRQIRVRPGANGEKVGDLLSPEKVARPVCADFFGPLDEFIATLT